MILNISPFGGQAVGPIFRQWYHCPQIRGTLAEEELAPWFHFEDSVLKIEAERARQSCALYPLTGWQWLVLLMYYKEMASLWFLKLSLMSFLGIAHDTFQELVVQFV